jgi:CBS domain-containing protein
MTTDPVALLATETIAKAAEVMRDDDIGDVIVLDDTAGRICGIVTDRDIVIRAVADGADPGRTTLSSVCSSDLVTVGPNDPVDEVIELMRSKAVRRVPVVEDDRPVGVISLGDLAVARDPDSVLGKISAASPDDA